MSISQTGEAPRNEHRSARGGAQEWLVETISPIAPICMKIIYNFGVWAPVDAFE